MYTFSSKKSVAKLTTFNLILMILLSFGLIAANFAIPVLNHIKIASLIAQNAKNRELARTRSQEVFLTRLSLANHILPNERLSVGVGIENAKKIPVLLYHGIVDNFQESSVSTDQFRDQMVSLKKAGWSTITLQDLSNFVSLRLPLPTKSFLLTFDDARKDSYLNADPILEALEYKATMFVITNTLTLNNNYYMSMVEIKNAVNSGRWEIGSHGKNTHKQEIINFKGEKGDSLSNKIWLANKNRVETNEEYRQRITNDLIDSKKDLENRSGISVSAFAFPYGDYGQKSINYKQGAVKIIDAAVKQVYKLAFYQPWGKLPVPSNYPGRDTFLIKRIGADLSWTAGDLLKTLEKTLN